MLKPLQWYSIKVDTLPGLEEYRTVVVEGDILAVLRWHTGEEQAVPKVFQTRPWVLIDS